MIQPKLAGRLILLMMALSASFGIPRLHAQEIIDPPPAKLITTFSFQLLSGGIIVVRGMLDDFPDTLNFILDTGSGGISLDSLTSERYHYTRIPSDRTIRGIGGIKQVEFTTGHRLKLPGLEAANLDFHINDYALLTSVYGIKVDGIIGFSFLRRYIVSIDYETNRIAVYTPGFFKYPRGGYLMRPGLSAIPVQTATVKDGKTVTNRFYFDTGAGLCFLLSEDFAKDSSVLKKNKNLIPTQAEGLGGKRPMFITVIKEIKLGPYRFRKVPTYVFQDQFNVTSYPTTGGLIGNDLLRRFNVVLNYPAQAIHIRPNKFFNSPFDYSYTGLGIYLENDEIVVDDVIKGSPGEKAGFKAGDRIMAVGNDFSHNIQAYRLLLQGTEDKIRVIVNRDGSPKLLILRVRNIMRRK